MHFNANEPSLGSFVPPGKPKCPPFKKVNLDLINKHFNLIRTINPRFLLLYRGKHGIHFP